MFQKKHRELRLEVKYLAPLTAVTDEQLAYGLYSPATIVKRRFSLSIDDHLNGIVIGGLHAWKQRVYRDVQLSSASNMRFPKKKRSAALYFVIDHLRDCRPFSRFAMARGLTKSFQREG